MDNKLLKLFTKENRVPTILPISYPGLQLMNYKIKEALFDAGKQYNIMKALTEEFELDIIFNFIDLVMEAEALGATIVYEEDAKPSVRVHPIKTLQDIENIKIPNPKTDERMATFIKTMNLMSKNLSLPKLAATAGPFTIAGELMGVTDSLKATIRDKDFLKKLLEIVTEILDRYIKAFIEAGADIIAICEPTGCMLSPAQFKEFSGDYIKKIFENNKEAIPILHMCGNTKHLLSEMVATGASGLSFDALMNLPNTAEVIPKDVAVIGNIDPVRILNQNNPKLVTDSVLQLKESMINYPNFILSSGCDLPHTVPIENIHALIDASRN